jgi:hypothetical protein
LQLWRLQLWWRLLWLLLLLLQLWLHSRRVIHTSQLLIGLLLLLLLLLVGRWRRRTTACPRGPLLRHEARWGRHAGCWRRSEPRCRPTRAWTRGARAHACWRRRRCHARTASHGGRRRRAACRGQPHEALTYIPLCLRDVGCEESCGGHRRACMCGI